MTRSEPMSWSDGIAVRLEPIEDRIVACHMKGCPQDAVWMCHIPAIDSPLGPLPAQDAALCDSHKVLLGSL